MGSFSWVSRSLRSSLLWLRALRAIDRSSFAVLLRRMDGFAGQALRVTSYSSSMLRHCNSPNIQGHAKHAARKLGPCWGASCVLIEDEFE